MKGKLFLKGKWEDGENYFPVYDPGKNEVIWEYPEATLQQIEDAISFLYKNRNVMKKLSKFERAQIFEKAKNIINERFEEIAKIISLESGKTINEARLEVSRALDTIEFTILEVKSYKEEVVPLDASKYGKGKFGLYTYEPLGVVGVITPFNFPLNLALHKIIPALGAGNVVVFKPSSYTPRTGQILVEILLEAGLPENAIAFLTGSGGKVGNPIVKNEKIRAISFTGSLEVGKNICKIAGMKRILLELGSNSAVVIFPDSEWEKYIDRIVRGAYALAGQVCISVQRIYVHKGIEEDFVDKFLEKLNKLKVGYQLDEETDIGPMIDEVNSIRVEEWVKEAKEKGAEILPGIKRSGTYFYPLLIKNCPEDLKVVKREVFGPVVVINTFESEEEVILKVNDSEYGLQCGVFTNDLNRAFKFYREIEVGGVIINDIPSFRVDLMPYGGVKGSGMGREGPHFSIKEYSEPKLLVLNL